MKKIDNDGLVQIQGGSYRKIAGCGAMMAAATWASIAMGPAALGIGTLTYAGCLLLEL